MLEQFIPVIVTAIFGFIVQPPIAEVGGFAGPYFPDDHNAAPLTRLTVGATGYSPLGDHIGVQFGAAYKQGGYSWSCWPCFDNQDEGHYLRDYLEMSLLGQVRIPVRDPVDLRIVLGPTYGLPVRCRRRNLTQGTERKCSTRLADARLVLGAGVAFPVSPRIDLAVSYRYHFNLREWDFFQLEVDGSIDLLASSLVAGVTYRRAG